MTVSGSSKSSSQNEDKNVSEFSALLGTPNELIDSSNIRPSLAAS